MKDELVVVAVVLTFVGYFPYVRDVLAHKTTPHVYTWFIWGLVTAIACALQIGDGAGSSALVTGAAAFVCFGIFGCAVRIGNTDIRRIDTACFVFALAAIVAWVVADNPVVAAAFVSAADLLGFVPTIRKSWHRPSEETLASYLANTFRFALAFYALQRYTIVTALYPLTWLIANGLFSLFLIWRRRALRCGIPA